MPIYHPIFPSGLIIAEKTNTIEEFLKHAYAWKLDHILLGRGRYYSDINAIHTGFIQIAFVERSMSIGMKGEIPKGSISFAMILNDATIAQQKYTITKEHLIVMEDGSELDVVFTHPVRILMIAIHKDLFKSKYEKKYNRAYHIHKTFDFWRCNPALLESAKEGLYQILAGIKTYPNLLSEPSYVSIIEETAIDYLLNLLWLHCEETNDSKPAEVAYSLYKSINLRYKEDVNINLLCNELKISQRNAYLTFQKHYNITPKQYLLSLRMTNIRNVLQKSNPYTTDIQKMALMHGFFHMSHFSKMYKLYFGELPSQTLAKNITNHQ